MANVAINIALFAYVLVSLATTLFIEFEAPAFEGSTNKFLDSKHE